MKKKRIIVAITGASGSIYARLLCEKLSTCPDVGEIALIVTENGAKVAQFEDSLDWTLDKRYTVYDNNDLFSAPASGSADFHAMVIIPCSMGMVGRVASGVSNDLISRAADVMLKQRRGLILVPRETPFSTLHLRNMASLSECGAVICPASPSFYSHPGNIEELCETLVERVAQMLGVETELYRWSGK